MSVYLIPLMTSDTLHHTAPETERVYLSQTGVKGISLSKYLVC